MTWTHFVPLAIFFYISFHVKWRRRTKNETLTSYRTICQPQMRSAFKVARVSKNFMCGRFSQLACTSLLNNQWEQARVIDILYRSDWNIIGYKIASEAWPRSPLFMFSYSLVRSVSVRKLFSLCHSLLDDLSLVAFPLGATLTHAITKKSVWFVRFDKHAKWNFLSSLEVIWFSSGRELCRRIW